MGQQGCGRCEDKNKRRHHGFVCCGKCLTDSTVQYSSPRALPCLALLHILFCCLFLIARLVPPFNLLFALRRREGLCCVAFPNSTGRRYSLLLLRARIYSCLTSFSFVSAVSCRLSSLSLFTLYAILPDADAVFAAQLSLLSFKQSRHVFSTHHIRQSQKSPAFDSFNLKTLIVSLLLALSCLLSCLTYSPFSLSSKEKNSTSCRLSLLLASPRTKLRSHLKTRQATNQN